MIFFSVKFILNISLCLTVVAFESKQYINIYMKHIRHLKSFLMCFRHILLHYFIWVIIVSVDVRYLFSLCSFCPSRFSVYVLQIL